MISIEKEGKYYTFYSSDKNYGGDIKFNETHCAMCFAMLSSEYAYIIEKLKRAKLLPNDFLPYCCSCFLVSKLTENFHCPKCHSQLNFWREKMSNIFKVKCTKCRYRKEIILP